MIREPGQQMDALGTSKDFVNVDFIPCPAPCALPLKIGISVNRNVTTPEVSFKNSCVFC